MHIPSSFDGEWHLELYCKKHRCNAIAMQNPPAIEWVGAWEMFRVRLEQIHCPKKDEFNGECFFMLLTDANRYFHGPHCFLNEHGKHCYNSGVEASSAGKS